jgi:ubiquinone/menaquinone biosynthesis C-methylase UbiE
MITFLSIMEHVTEQEAILGECRRVLRKGGVIFINSPSWFGKFVLENIILRFLDKKGMYAAQVDTHTTYFSRRQMWQVVRNAGFVSSEILVWPSNFFCSVSACAIKKND